MALSYKVSSLLKTRREGQRGVYTSAVVVATVRESREVVEKADCIVPSNKISSLPKYETKRQG